MKKTIGIIFGMLFLGTAINSVSAQDKPKVGDLIYGTVTDSQGPVAGVVITERNRFDRIMAQVKTDENGNFLEEEYIIENIPESKKIKEPVNMNTVYKKFGRFRCAYISENGEVLGVTDTAVSTLAEDENNILTVSGTAAEYRFHSDNADMAKRLKTPAGILSLGAYVLFFIMIIALGVIVIRNLWKFIRQMQKK